MYLFQPNYDDIDLLNNIIYIPLCIYFNMYMSPLLPEYLYIYIPLCIYFNQSKIKEQNLFQTHLHSTMYLFQRQVVFFQYCYNIIYIPLCIYFNIVTCRHNLSAFIIYIPLCIYFNFIKNILKIKIIIIYIPLCIYFNK